MNHTIQYYNTHADEYFKKTSSVDMTETYSRFLKYVPVGGRIMDLGCGSGRDVAWFRDHGYDAYGLDASEEMVRLAQEKLGIPVEAGNIETWVTNQPYDGIWCCAALLHLNDEKVVEFFSHLNINLKESGVVFLTVKCDVNAGDDECGRYMRGFSENDIKKLTSYCEGLNVREVWYTQDKLSRRSLKWLNILMVR